MPSKKKAVGKSVQENKINEKTPLKKTVKKKNTVKVAQQAEQAQQPIDVEEKPLVADVLENKKDEIVSSLPGKNKKSLIMLMLIAVVTLLVVIEVGYLMKSKSDRQRAFREVTTIGERGGQKRTEAFQGTTAQKVDSLDRLLLVDSEWKKVMVYDLKTDKLLFVIDEKTVDRPLFSPADAASDGKGNIFVLDSIHQDVSVIDQKGMFIERWPAQNGVALSVTQKGEVVVADNNKMEVRKFSPGGELLKTMGGAGNSKGRFIRPYRMAIDGKDNLYIIDQGNKRLQVFGSNNKPKAMWPLKFDPNNLTGITIFKDEIFVNDFSNGFIWIYNENGKMLGQIKIAYPSNLAADSQGYFYLPGPGGIARFIMLKGKEVK